MQTKILKTSEMRAGGSVLGAKIFLYENQIHPGSFDYRSNPDVVCCRDWRSWARPQLDLQKRYVLMFQSPASASKTLQPYLSGQKVASRLRLDR